MTPLVDGRGCWRWAAAPGAPQGSQPALFLDRDGVVVTETEFLSRIEDVSLIAGAAETIAGFNRGGIPVILITNQSGIARGYYSWGEFETVHEEVLRQLAAAGATVNGVFACGYHPEGIGPLGIAEHPWRKPQPGMLLEAASTLGIVLDASWVVGDRATDLAAGRAAGLAGGLHVMTGHADEQERLAAQSLARPGFAVRTAPDVRDADSLLELMTRSVAC